MNSKPSLYQDQDQESLFQINQRASSINKKYVRWTSKENREYVQFLKENYSMFNDALSRKSKAIFNKMALMLKNGRNNHQCRSHHMKMLKKCGSIEKIISMALKFNEEKDEEKNQKPLILTFNHDQKDQETQNKNNSQVLLCPFLQKRSKENQEINKNKHKQSILTSSSTLPVQDTEPKKQQNFFLFFENNSQTLPSWFNKKLSAFQVYNKV